MGIFSRFSDIVNSNLNAMLDKAEDPLKIVRLIVQEMEDTLVEVRSSAARAIAERKELDRKIERLGRERDEWESKAELAVDKGREDLARAALVEKNKVADAAEALEAQRADVEHELEKLNEDIGQLQKKLAEAKQRQQSLLKRHNAATQRLKVKKRIHDERIDDAMARFEGFESKMDRLEGKAEAYDMGRPKTLDDEFAELETDERVNRDLEALKKRRQGGSGGRGASKKKTSAR